jgi:putative transcriptional regulator
MSTIVTKRLNDGSYIELGTDGATRPSPAQIDWAAFDAITDEEATAAALSDPDAQPLSDDNAAFRERLPQARVIRRALRLTQEDFAARYHIPIGTLRDWEQGRSVPDQPARAYLHAIAGDPEAVFQALKAKPQNRASIGE